jgi:hypothetical protein
MVSNGIPIIPRLRLKPIEWFKSSGGETRSLTVKMETRTRLGPNNPTAQFAQRFSSCCYRTYWQTCYSVGRDGSVGIATRYGLNGPEIKFRFGRGFLHPSRMTPRPTQPPMKGDWGIALTTHPHLAPWIRMGRAILLPTLRAVSPYYRVTFTFNMCQCLPPLGLRDWRWGLRYSGTRRNVSNLSPNDTATHRTPPESPGTLYFCKSRPAVGSQCPRAYCTVTNIESLLSSVTCSSSSHILPPFPFHFLDNRRVCV